MLTTKVWICMCLVLGHVCLSDARLCYECSDSSDDVEKSDCYFAYRKLKRERNSYEIDKVEVKDLHSINDCSGVCKIETIEAYGKYTAFIRDCSDNKTFSINATRLRNLNIDNQTTCDFSPQHKATICVSLCDSDFCNGPAGTGSYVTASMATTAYILMVSLLLVVFG